MHLLQQESTVQILHLLIAYLFEAVPGGLEIMLQGRCAALCQLILLQQSSVIRLQHLQVMLQLCCCASGLLSLPATYAVAYFPVSCMTVQNVASMKLV